MIKFLRRAAAASTTIAASSIILSQVVSAATYDTYYATGDAAAASGILASFGIVYCCVLCVILAVLIGLAVFVYKDAQKNKVDNAAIWAVLTFFTGIIGLLIYLLAIKPEAVKKMSGGSTTTTSTPAA